MKKLISVLLSVSFLFVVAACNKDNSKAKRLNKDEVTNQQKAQQEKQKLEEEKKKKEQEEAAKQEEIAKAKREEIARREALAREEENSGDTAEEKEGQKNKKGLAAPVVVAGSLSSAGSSKTGSSVGTSVPSSQSSEASAKVEGSAKTETSTKVEVDNEISKLSADVRITPNHTANYVEVDMSTSASSNQIKIPALLNIDAAKKDEKQDLIVYCYDKDEIKKNPVKENLPVLYMQPQSEALIEIKRSVGNPNDATDRNMQKINPSYVLNNCQGAGNTSEIKEDDTYQVIKLKPDENRDLYLRNDPDDRIHVNFSVTCSSSKIKEEPTKDKKLSRITLSSKSRIFFAQPVKYVDKDKDGNKTTYKVSKKMKDYAVVECE